jgi:hypothetical protein
MDSSSLVAAGLLDGIHGSWSLRGTRLSLGAFYTGLLYKEQAKIIMTVYDLRNYAAELDYGDMSTYFASRRLLVPLTVEFPSLTEKSSLALNGIAQFDLNNTDDAATLHSQYLGAHYIAEPLEPLRLDLAVVGGIVEANETQAIIAASAGAAWELPTALQDQLFLQARWSSGRMNDTIREYLPVNGIAVGEIFAPRLSGVLYGKASYMARPHTAVSFEGGFGYFVRTDVETLQDPDLDPNSGSRLLGGEVYGAVAWAPQSPLKLTARGGVFFPGMGKAFLSDASIRGKASLEVTVSF